MNERTCFAGNFGDRPHSKTGATALHVAAAKGYIKVINLLIQAGGEINQQVGQEKKSVFELRGFDHFSPAGF